MYHCLAELFAWAGVDPVVGQRPRALLLEEVTDLTRGEKFEKQLTHWLERAKQ